MKRRFILLILAALILTGCGADDSADSAVNSMASISAANVPQPSRENTTAEMEPTESPASMEQKENRDTQNKTEDTTADEPQAEKSETPPPAEEEMELCVGFAKEVFDQTNAERAAAGLPELIWSDELARAADIRAEEIVDEEHFSHVRPDGTKCYVLSDKIHGENIGRGPHANGYEFVQHWMESEGHKWNILCDKYTLIGVGTRCTEQGDTGVQLFGY